MHPNNKAPCYTYGREDSIGYAAKGGNKQLSPVPSEKTFYFPPPLSFFRRRRPNGSRPVTVTLLISPFYIISAAVYRRPAPPLVLRLWGRPSSLRPPVRPDPLIASPPPASPHLSPCVPSNKINKSPSTGFGAPPASSSSMG